MSANKSSTDIAIIGAGIAGIAAAYYIKKSLPKSKVSLIEAFDPMGFTSAQSGENYRSWWPHPSMARFISHSIDLMEEIAIQSDNRIHMSRKGYLLATRADGINDIVDNLQRVYGGSGEQHLRVHELANGSYQLLQHDDWASSADGIDVLMAKAFKQEFPQLDPTVKHLIHIRRAGDISAQQLGQWMLEQSSDLNLQRIKGEVLEIKSESGFKLKIKHGAETCALHSDIIINAAGPFANHISNMLNEPLPIHNVLQQKIAFQDQLGIIDRNSPFLIDMDHQCIDWNEEEREWLSNDPEGQKFLAEMPGGIHCRPDGGANSQWIKMGWAYNQSSAEAQRNPALDDHFPEIVLRGASRLQPGLKAYIGRLPKKVTHYGGWYTMTEENFPIIGPYRQKNAYAIAALSGFGSMAACAAGELIGAYISGSPLPEYADDLGLNRYQNETLMREISTLYSRGVL